MLKPSLACVGLTHRIITCESPANLPANAAAAAAAALSQLPATPAAAAAALGQLAEAHALNPASPALHALAKPLAHLPEAVSQALVAAEHPAWPAPQQLPMMDAVSAQTLALLQSRQQALARSSPGGPR